MNVNDRIGEMSVEFVALVRLAEDKAMPCLDAATLALKLVTDINDLCLTVPIAEVSQMERRIRSHTAWVANGPVAQA